MVLAGAGQGVEMEKLARDGIEKYERDGIGVPPDWPFRDCIDGFVGRSRSDPGQVDSGDDWRNKRTAAIVAAQSRTSTEA